MKNGVMLQAFEWNTEGGGTFYDRIRNQAAQFAGAGFTALWLPPAFKGTSSLDVGYGTYDLYDLGEFDQKEETRTKYGTKAQYLDCVRELKRRGLEVYADVVLNHKAGADGVELFRVVEVNRDDRTEVISDPFDIEGWTRFDFPGRGGRYSAFKWNFNHFSGVDYDRISNRGGIFKILGDNKDWSRDVSSELGNFDYLMFADVNTDHPDVRDELKRWSDWFIAETGVDGFRMDAVKHISADFMRDFVEHVKEQQGDQFYFVGEYWKTDSSETNRYLYETNYDMDIFDVKLHFHFAEAAWHGAEYDLRTVFDNTVVREHPALAVTFVDNHDSQPGQALESWVGEWFKPLAYALILLRKDGYPCVFAGDYWGINGDPDRPGFQSEIDRLLRIRRQFLSGDQEDRFDHPNLIGWIQHGDDENPGKLATLVCTSDDEMRMRIEFGPTYAGRVFADYSGRRDDKITLDENGAANFPVSARSYSVWGDRSFTA